MFADWIALLIRKPVVGQSDDFVCVCEVNRRHRFHYHHQRVQSPKKEKRTQIRIGAKYFYFFLFFARKLSIHHGVLEAVTKFNENLNNFFGFFLSLIKYNCVYIFILKQKHILLGMERRRLVGFVWLFFLVWFS